MKNGKKGAQSAHSSSIRLLAPLVHTDACNDGSRVDADVQTGGIQRRELGDSVHAIEHPATIIQQKDINRESCIGVGKALSLVRRCQWIADDFGRADIEEHALVRNR